MPETDAECAGFGTAASVDHRWELCGADHGAGQVNSGPLIKAGRDVAKHNHGNTNTIPDTIGDNHTKKK